MKRIENEVNQITAYNILLLFRRLTILHCRSTHQNGEDCINQVFKLLCHAMNLERQYSSFPESKLAIAHCMASHIPAMTKSPVAVAQYLKGLVYHCHINNRLLHPFGVVLHCER